VHLAGAKQQRLRKDTAVALARATGGSSPLATRLLATAERALPL